MFSPRWSSDFRSRQTTDNFFPTIFEIHKDSCAFWELPVYYEGWQSARFFIRNQWYLTERHICSLKPLPSEPDAIPLTPLLLKYWEDTWSARRKMLYPPFTSQHSKWPFCYPQRPANADSFRSVWGEAREEILIPCPSSAKQWASSFTCFSGCQLLQGKKSVAALAKMLKLRLGLSQLSLHLHFVLILKYCN